MDTERTWDLFRRCRPLAHVSAAAMRGLFEAAEERAFQPGDTMIRQGDPADGLLVLLEGTAHARLRAPDGDHWLGSFTGGDVTGEMALVTREPRNADVIAGSPVRALLVPTAAFDALAAQHLELGMVLTTLVAERLGRSDRDGFGGKLIDDFQIIRCIGRGGMSVVYEAQDVASGDRVALKMMSYRLLYDSAALARFRQESELQQSLEHENIARLKRLFPAFRTYFLVIELCEGADLRRLTARCGRLPEAQVRAILGQLSAALHYIHQRGLVHRDLKPANVMLTPDGCVKLTDFGLAMPVILAENEVTRALDESVMGTPTFMAPEQLAGGRLDARTDLYAMACMAVELLRGAPLFTERNVFDLAVAKSKLVLPPASEIGGGISDELYAFLQSALSVDPANRPRSAEPLTKWATRCDPPPDLLGNVLADDEETR